ncbi:MAG: hypothetical protein WBH01_03590 [Dehalococcoidia bacterium]
MRIGILICCILALAMLALTGLSYAAEIPSEVSVTGIDNGVIIQNVGNIPCLLVVNSLEGEQQFELAVGANVTLVTLSNITGTTFVLAFGSTTVRVDLEEMEKFAKAREKLGKIKLNLSSNFTDP